MFPVAALAGTIVSSFIRGEGVGFTADATRPKLPPPMLPPGVALEWFIVGFRHRSSIAARFSSVFDNSFVMKRLFLAPPMKKTNSSPALREPLLAPDPDRAGN